MKYEDSRFALFTEPNAYIQRFDRVENKEKKVQKIVFQEPYETLPNYHINNNFAKHTCDCVSKPNFASSVNKLKNNYDLNHGCQSDFDNKKSKSGDKFDVNLPKQKFFGLDLSGLLPLLGLFNKSGGADFSQMANILNNNAGVDFNPMNIISKLLSNKDSLSGILKIFKGGQNNNQINKVIKTTDFEIKNYTRVD